MCIDGNRVKAGKSKATVPGCRIALDSRGNFKYTNDPAMPSRSLVWSKRLIALKKPDLVVYIPRKQQLTVPKIVYAYPPPLMFLQSCGDRSREWYFQQYIFGRKDLSERQWSIAALWENQDNSVSFQEPDKWRTWLNDYNELDPRTEIEFYKWTVRRHMTRDEAQEFVLLPDIMRVAMWEVFDNNFRCEIIALECYFRAKASPSEPVRQRREKLLETSLEGHSLVVTSHPDRRRGLAGTQWLGRVECMRALAELEQYWPESNKHLIRPSVYHGMTKDLVASEELYLKFEEKTIDFYLHSFFFAFIRVPIIPFELPVLR